MNQQELKDWLDLNAPVLKSSQVDLTDFTFSETQLCTSDTLKFQPLSRAIEDCRLHETHVILIESILLKAFRWRPGDADYGSMPMWFDAAAEFMMQVRDRQYLSTRAIFFRDGFYDLTIPLTIRPGTNVFIRLDNVFRQSLWNQVVVTCGLKCVVARPLV
jgi:hypothetical protein